MFFFRYVAAAAASQPTTQPDPQPSRSGRLLSLIRKLIDYGTALVATVRQRVAADPIFAAPASAPPILR